MTLPRSRAEVAPVAAIALVDEGRELVLGQRLRAGTRARIAISASSLVARSSRPAAAEGLDRFAAGLDLARQDGEVLVVGQGRALRASRRCRRRSTAMRRTSRRSASPPRMAAAMSVWMRSRRVTGLATSGGRSADARGGSPGRPWGAGLGGRRWRRAQPACVRAFFLRFASLRLRFTDGFS